MLCFFFFIFFFIRFVVTLCFAVVVFLLFPLSLHVSFRWVYMNWMPNIDVVLYLYFEKCISFFVFSFKKTGFFEWTCSRIHQPFVRNLWMCVLCIVYICSYVFCFVQLQFVCLFCFGLIFISIFVSFCCCCFFVPFISAHIFP